MNAREAIDAYLDARGVRDLSPRTVRSLRSDLAHFARWSADRDVTELGTEEITSYVAALRALPHSRSYIEKIAGCVRRLLGWLTRRSVLIVDPSAPLCVSFAAKPLPRVLNEKETEALVDAPPDLAPWSGHPAAPWALRDKAILELLYSSGLRRAEITSLDVGDVDLAGGFVTVRRGKGAKDRIVPVGRAAVDAIRDYIEHERPQWLSAPCVTALFLSTRGPRRGTRMQPNAINDRVRCVATRALRGKHVTPHVLRHTLATHLLRAGAGLRHVQEMLGHASIQTTTRYTHLTIGDLRRAHQQTHPRGKR